MMGVSIWLQGNGSLGAGMWRKCRLDMLWWTSGVWLMVVRTAIPGNPVVGHGGLTSCCTAIWAD